MLLVETVEHDKAYRLQKKKYGNLIKISSNGGTDDSSIYKCFSLGFSCLWILQQIYYQRNLKAVNLLNSYMIRWSPNLVINMTQTKALTWDLNAVSATCFGKFCWALKSQIPWCIYCRLIILRWIILSYFFVLVFSNTLTWAFSWQFNPVKPNYLYLWETEFMDDHAQITSNRATSDSCVYKCFFLELSWLWQVSQWRFISTKSH